MKAFIVLALVAVAASRSVDVETMRLLNKDNKPVEDLFLNKVHRFTNWPTTKTFDFTPSTYTPYTPYTYGDDVDTYNYNTRRVSILSLEELVSHPLFREYLQLPLFVQMWEEHPVLFRRYIESPLFQQFWTVPQFQRYFRNPIFFYKYIVPQLQIIAQTPFIGSYDYPTTTYGNEGREFTFDSYLNKIFGKHQNTFYPYAYQQRTTPFSGYEQEQYHHYYPTTTQYHQYQPYGYNVNYKYLLDKIYRTLFLNKPTYGDVTQVKTDVTVEPAHKEIVVEPVTGEQKVVVQEPKIVDVKVDEQIVSKKTEETETDILVKETLLKRLFVTKQISYELYTVLKTLPLHHVREIIKRIVNPTTFDYNNVDELNKYYNVDFNNVDVDDVYRQKLSQIFNPLFHTQRAGDRYSYDQITRDLLKVVGHHNVPTVEDVRRHF